MTDQQKRIEEARPKDWVEDFDHENGNYLRSADERVKAINLTIRKLETQKKKFEAILGEGQKGVAE